MGIKLKLTIILVSMVAILMLFVGSLIYNSAKENLLIEQRNKLNLVASVEAAYISKSINDLTTDLLSMQEYYNINLNLPILIAAGDDKQSRTSLQAKKMLDHQLSVWVRYKEIVDDLMLVSPDGNVVYAVNPEHTHKETETPLLNPLTPGNWVGEKDIHFTNVLKTQDEEHSAYMLITGPAFDLSGNYAGVIVLEINMNVLTTKFLNLKTFGTTGEIYLINKDKLMISGSRFIENAVLNTMVDTENARRCLLKASNSKGITGVHERNAEQGFEAFPDYRGIDVFGANVFIPELQWGLLVEIDASEAFASINNIRNLTFVIAAIVLFLVFVVSYATAQAITKPILELQKGADIIGMGNLDYKVATTSKDEVGQLSRAFDVMIQHLKAVTGSLKLEIAESKKKEEQIKTKSSALEKQIEKSEKQRIATLSILSDLSETSTALKSEVSERKKAQEELLVYQNKLEKLVEERTTKLEEANKELDSFAYSVSHDLRAPLRVIHGFTGILMEDYSAVLDEEGKRLASIIQKNAMKMAQLIDELLTFSHMGRSNISSSLIDMKSLANTIYHESTKPKERKRIAFNIADLPKVKGDHAMIRQVWINFISNALKFSSRCKKANIIIDFKQEMNSCTYFIKDNGAGFDMNYKNQLFNVFQRLHSEDEFEGNGVGLALVQRIVNRHGGKIWAEGKVNEGATFYFSLPKNT